MTVLVKRATGRVPSSVCSHVRLLEEQQEVRPMLLTEYCDELKAVDTGTSAPMFVQDLWPRLGNADARLQCKIYIADDKPSRSQHENGLKHKGNVDRYVREVYKKGETNKKDKADEAAELARVNNVRLSSLRFAC